MPELSDPQIYQSVLEKLETGVYIVDRNRRIRFWNEGAEQITGFLRQDVVGRFLREHLLALGGVPIDFESDPDDPITVAFRDGKPSILEVSILHKNGYRVPIVLRTSPIRNSCGLVVGVAESFEKNRSAADTTRRQSMYSDLGCLDVLTGIAAQSFMETQLRENLTTFAEHGIPFGILLIEIDRLDQLKASRGPGVAPTVLRVVAESLENSLRPTDHLGCWRANQFLAVLMECKESGVFRVGERARRMIAMAEIEWWGDKFSVTCPVGGAGCREGDTIGSLMARAEASLRESVEKGGNRVIVLT